MTPKLSFNARRIITSVMCVPLFVSVVDHLGQYRWFWPCDSSVISVSGLIAFIALGLIGPTIEEMREHRDKKGREALERMEASSSGEIRERESERQ